MGMKCKICGKFHTKLNKGMRLISHKYLEGKMQRTLEKELKEFEFADR